MTSVLFVCTGNICRSPTAEAVFNHVAESKGVVSNFTVRSAGTHGYHVGEPPDARAVEKAAGRGFSMKGMSAQKVVISDFDDFDYIVAMDRGHLEILNDLQPANTKAEVVLFMDYCDSYSDKDVPDPYYGGDEGFDVVLDIIEDGVEGLLQKIS